MTKTYYDIEIKITDISSSILNKVGYIRYYKLLNTIKIVGLYINEPYQGQGYGTSLIILSLCHIIKQIPGAYFIQKICLEDCSSQTLTKNSIYYKLGFRIIGDDDHSLMQIKFLRPYPRIEQQREYYKYNGENESSFAYYQTIIEYYLKSTHQEKIQTIFIEIINKINLGQIHIFLSSNFDEVSRTFLNTEIFNIYNCFDISSIIGENIHNTRSKKSNYFIP